jgi:putative membrane protein
LDERLYIRKTTIAIVDSLVLCIDRDDDIGRKAGIKGPIIGRERNLEAAQKLALADPADTDVNALYGAIKLAQELETEVVTLTGESHVGVVSDKEIARQLEEVLKSFKPNSIMFVSDGLDDEQVLPIIQSRVKVDSVLTITVRQSKELEKAYFKLAHFIKEVTGDPALARLIFGLPGIALVLLSVGGIQALSWIMGVIGIYLIIKGFGLEEQFFTTTSDFLKSLSVERMSTLLYVVGAIIGLLGIGYGWQDMQRMSLTFTDSNTTLNTVGLFILNSSAINLILLAAVVVITARVIDEWALKRFIHVRRYFILAGFLGMIAFLMQAGAKYIISEEYSFQSFALSGLAGVLSLAVWIKLTEYFFRSEIRAIEDIMRRTEGKEVEDADGAKLGKVTKAVVEHLQLKEIRVGAKVIQKKDIMSIGETITVKKGEPMVSPPSTSAADSFRGFRFQPPQSFPKIDLHYPRQKKKP